MTVATSSAISAKVKIDCPRELTIKEMVGLAQALDEYEIEYKTSKSLVIDTKSLNLDGTFEFFITPHYTITYKEVHEHIERIVPYSLKKAGLSDFSFKVIELSFLHKALGNPSFVSAD